ncbi:MAG TPA: hypothetical protein VFL62_25475 [Bradyrhizobium sp.]|uniref:outer membrane protein n=1 Tax=Bradyrhizobium sp. TaxID=376 RepID=UPI002D80D766|nr:hypothetical protein [Bradyrhizobium sp.]HET7889596.1 hypothetical protein [Bradyrhizobium sp.]
MKANFIIAAVAAGFIALASTTTAQSQSQIPPVTGAEAGHLTAAGTGAIREVSAGRRHYEYYADFCKVIERGSRTLVEIRDAQQRAYISAFPGGSERDPTQLGYAKGLEKLGDELQKTLDQWFSYYNDPRCNPPYRTELMRLRNEHWTGFSLGTYLIGINRAKEEIVETSRDTGDKTNSFRPVGDPQGFGVQAAYLFSPWHDALRVGPFASFDVLHQTVNQNFAGGQFLGTTTHWLVTTGGKFGGVVTPDIFVYGLAGVSWLNRNLNVNFATAASSTVNTAGFTAGFGGEWHPLSWQLAGHPVTLFAQYQHTWWDTANFYAPASSPAFNYAFTRGDDTVKFGVNFYFGAGPQAPSYPVKALITK